MYACTTRVSQAYVCLCDSKRYLHTRLGQLGPTEGHFAALGAVQEAAESTIVEIFEVANLLVIHQKHVIVLPRHLVLLKIERQNLLYTSSALDVRRNRLPGPRLQGQRVKKEGARVEE